MESPRYLRPAEAARAWPHSAQPPHPSKVIRAIVRGKASRQRPGERIKLRAVNDGQHWLTTAEWIEEYLTAITADRGGCAPKAAMRARGTRAIARLVAKGW
jgi:hypothetical protein